MRSIRRQRRLKRRLGRSRQPHLVVYVKDAMEASMEPRRLLEALREEVRKDTLKKIGE